MTDTSPLRIAQIEAGRTGSTLGLASASPSLRWRFEGDAPVGHGCQQAYEIRMVRDGITETTGRVESSDQTSPWPFEPLRSRERVTLAVRAWIDETHVTGWSEDVELEGSLFSSAEWSAHKVGPPRDLEAGRESAVFRIRRVFDAQSVRRARLYLAAHGLVVPYLNGGRVGDELLAPGWTSYDHRLRFRVHDVTAALRAGRNVLGFELAEGWYRGRFGFDHGARGIYGVRIGVIAQLEIEHDDGSVDVLPTDPTWEASLGPTTFTNLYDGEETDLRMADTLWCMPEAASAGDWSAVVASDFDRSTLVPADSPPVRRTQEVAPVSIEQVREGVARFDFGQNLVGRLRVRVDGPAGATVTVRHAEVLEGGELGVRPLRLARATDRLTLPGGQATWEPEFTTHGFRYAEIATSDGRVRLADVVAEVVHSDMRRTGWLETSNPQLNRLFDNAVWGLRGNFVDLPTDCPQRDERLGWTGDIHVFAETATQLYDVSGVLGSWLQDLQAEQLAHPDRIPPMFVPSIITEPHLAGVWGDATVGVPWALYRRDGDVERLRANYESVCAWIALVEGRLGATGVWDTDVQLGDWLDPTAPPDAPHAGRTDPHLVATAYFIRSCRLAASIARVLGEDGDAARFAERADQVRGAFRSQYMAPSGRLASDSQTAYALAICFELYDSDFERACGGQRLRELVRSMEHRVGTGFVGTALILDALCRTGSAGDAWAMLSQTALPSFLYPVTMGATTAWERWDSMLPDGRINPGEMTSFNHYALGSVAGWLMRGIGGITSIEPGGSRVRVEPIPGGDVRWARSKQVLPRGEVRTSWEIADGRFALALELPFGIVAEVVLPDGARHVAEAGAHTWECEMPERLETLREPARRARQVVRTRYP